MTRRSPNNRRGQKTSQNKPSDDERRDGGSHDDFPLAPDHDGAEDACERRECWNGLHHLEMLSDNGLTLLLEMVAQRAALHGPFRAWQGWAKAASGRICGMRLSGDVATHDEPFFDAAPKLDLFQESCEGEGQERGHVGSDLQNFVVW